MIGEERAVHSDAIYLDYAASTPIDNRVLGAMADAHAVYANPHSLQYESGRHASALIEKAREQAAHSIGGTPKSIIFTSGATESNNLAILGAATGGHIITCNTEHASVLGPCRALERDSRWRVTYLPVDRFGRLSTTQLSDAMTDDTVLVSLMWANNEIGTLHDVERIGQLARAQGVLFHCDATQALGRAEVDVDRCGIDMLSVSGHKIYGPRGTGFLYVREPKRLRPLFWGGGQQCGIRPGTMNTPGIVGLGVACELATNELNKNTSLVDEVTRHARSRLTESIADTHMLTPGAGAIAGILCVAFDGVEAEALMGFLDNVAVSQGSACDGMRAEPSHVLVALGVTDLLLSAIRLSFGKHTTLSEVDVAVERIRTAVQTIRSFAPRKKLDLSPTKRSK